MNKLGTVSINNDVYSYELTNDSYSDDDYSRINNNRILRVGDVYVAPYGSNNNNLPIIIRELVKQNQILPELIEKQIRYLYGKGPYLYEEIADGDASKRRVPVKNNRVLEWLGSWKKNGLRYSYQEYLIKCIQEFYYLEGIYSKYVLNKGRRIGNIPILGLESISGTKARKGTYNDKYAQGFIELDDADLDKIVVGDWSNLYSYNYNIFPRFDDTKPFVNNAINYSQNFSFGEDIYSFPVFYHSLKHWLQGSNLNPIQLNSFFENLLTAKYHVKIPETWIEGERTIISEIVNQNVDMQIDGLTDSIIQEYKGVCLVNDDGSVKDVSRFMLMERIRYELEQLTSTMSGVDKAGKTFSTIQYGDDSWTIEEIPAKIKDFIESLIKTNTHAVEVILAGKGLDPAISNVSKEGVISKSGSDAYYQYMIYISNLTIPEETVVRDINNAISLNFPDTNVKLGFLHHIPSRQEEVAPEQRLNNNIS